MGYRATVLGTQRVALTRHYWADVRPLTSAEMAACREVLLGGPLTSSLDGGVAGAPVTLHDRDYLTALLCRSIVAWNLDDDDGHPLPLTDETVQQLSAADALALVRLVRRLNEPLATPEARRD